MTIVRSLLTVARTCPCCWGKGKIRYRGDHGPWRTCPHCEGTGSVLEKDGV